MEGFISFAFYFVNVVPTVKKQGIKRMLKGGLLVFNFKGGGGG